MNAAYRGGVLIMAGLLFGCATPDATDMLMGQAYVGLRSSSFGKLDQPAGNATCAGPTRYRSSAGTRGRIGRKSTIPAAADKLILSEQLQDRFSKLVGATGWRSMLDAGAVVAIIQNEDDRVAFWRVVEEVPFGEVADAAEGYCSRSDRGRHARLIGQAYSCTSKWPTPISVGSERITVQFTHAISQFECTL